jgi:transcriptional regulator with GAF, ATPase, and Fis domain/CHASE2 domain-containing sensor protein
MKHISFGIGCLVVCLLLIILFSSPLDQFDRFFLDVKFKTRGESRLDTNIVILYLDNDNIKALGGWPISRDYYVLAIKNLMTLGVKAVGLDVFLGETKLQHSDYDTLLASKAKSTICCTSYFEQFSSLPDTAPSVPLGDIERFSYGLSGVNDFFSGSGLNLPFPLLVDSAKALGHSNIPKERTVYSIPLLLRYGDRLLPAFSFELARLYFGVEKGRVTISNRAVILNTASGAISIPLDDNGSFHINYVCGTDSLMRNSYRFLDFLQACTARQDGQTTDIPLERFKDKIVLIGVIADGIITYTNTPFTPLYPPLGIHAAVIDNILTGNYLHTLSAGWVYLISLIFGSLALMLMYRFGELRGVVFVVLLLAGYVLLSFLLFVKANLSLPIVQPGLMMAAIAFIILAQKQWLARGTIAVLADEKQNVEQELREREEKLQLLEQELLNSAHRQDAAQPATLLQEIRKYKNEIKELSTQVGDLTAYHVDIEDKESLTGVYEDIIYDPSGKMGEVISLVKKIAPGDANVLILGESGTGKELVARAIHKNSARTGKQFIAVNCGALSEGLLESELFGHVKGAFTGAVKDKPGRFELAHEGTMFLDEIAETSEAFQVKLLRVLQQGEFERVGGTETLKVSVRVIAATNKDPKQLIAERKFREDLYYRLNVLQIQLPPLRERRGDIPILVSHFLKNAGEEFTLSHIVMEAFLSYDWKGNVRELESIITRATILAKAEERTIIRIKDLPEEIAACSQTNRDIEVQILELLREKRFSRSSISEAAEELGGIHRGTVAEYLRGICFQNFCEHRWDFNTTVDAIANAEDTETKTRVEKKVREYLENVIEFIDTTKSPDEIKTSVRPKYKNLPQRYHFYLDEIVQAYCDGRWRL